MPAPFKANAWLIVCWPFSLLMAKGVRPPGCFLGSKCSRFLVGEQIKPNIFWFLKSNHFCWLNHHMINPHTIKLSYPFKTKQIYSLSRVLINYQKYWDVFLRFSLIKSKVSIINGNGATWNTCEGICGRLDWNTSPIHWKNTNKYAPIAPRIGFQPPKIVIARTIQPMPSIPDNDPFHPAFKLREYIGPANPTRPEPMIVYKYLIEFTCNPRACADSCCSPAALIKSPCGVWKIQ